MKTILLAALVLSIGGCKSSEKDETKAMNGITLSSEQRERFNADGIAPRMKLDQVSRTLRARHPVIEFDEKPSWKTVYYIGVTDADGHRDQTVVESNDNIAGYPVFEVKVAKYYEKGAKLETLMKTLTEKYGALIKPVPYDSSGSGGDHVETSEGIYFAGEATTSNGKLLKRCVSKFEIATYPTADCGLMARIQISETGGIVRAVTVDLLDNRFKTALENRVSSLRSAARANKLGAQHDEAQAINSF